MKRIVVLVSAIFLFISIANAEQLTKKDIIDMTKKGMSHEEILQKIAETHSRFTLTVEEEDWLRSEGVSDWVIRFMKLLDKPDKKAHFLERGDIERGGIPVCGGKYYDDAAEIRPGIYRLDHQLKANEYDYFKIRLKNGQRLTCSIRTTDVSYHSGISIHSSERTRIKEAYVNDASLANSCFHEIFDLSQEGQIFYILVGSHYPVNENVAYTIELDDHYDAGSMTDAGNYFDTALEIRPGEYKDNWAPYADVDMYKISIRKGQKLEARLVPEKTERFHRITVLNKDRETLGSRVSKERGSVAKISVTNDGADQAFYIKVDHNGYDFQPEGKYILKVDLI